MNGKNYLLDTNIIIASFAGDNTIKEKIRVANKVFIPITVIGELYFGAEKSGKKENNKAKIEELIKSSLILKCDVETAKHYGIIKNQLKIKGSLIPENDIWIGSIAAHHGLTIASRDKHFNQIDSLEVEGW